MRLLGWLRPRPLPDDAAWARYRRARVADFQWTFKMATPLRKMWEPGIHQFYSPEDWRYLWARLHEIAVRWAGPMPYDRVNFWILASGLVHSAGRVPFGVTPVDMSTR